MKALLFAGPDFAEAYVVQRPVTRCASAWALVATTAIIGCAPPAIRSTLERSPTPVELRELWVDPAGQARNLVNGPGRHTAPAVDSRFELLERDPRGYSITYRVRDDAGQEWNVKIGPEAQPEVVASRILWALGYHQLPAYFVERWVLTEAGQPQTLGGARFRPRNDGFDGKGLWSWQQNPFVGTRPYNGLLSLLMLINSTDLKNENNEVYEVEGQSRGQPQRVYIVKDLGASLGETGRVDPRRGFIDGFEREPFLRGRDGPWVRFAFRGRHQELLQQIPTEDLRWMCERVLALSDRQWRDAFGAAHYDTETTGRYIARLRAKAREGLAIR